MIRLVQIEKNAINNLTSWCKMCYNTGQTISKDVCDTCLGFLSTSIECPKCGEAEKYNGCAAPDKCIVCKHIFPNLNRLKESEKTRVEYSIEEESC